MSTVTFGELYPDGTAFDAEGHADNLYSASSGTGIHSERNGRLTVANFSGGMSIRASDILAGEAHRVYSDQGLRGIAYVANEIPDNTETGFVGVWQMGMRFKLPYAARAIEWNWQTFLHEFRMRSEELELDNALLDFEVEMAAMVDGTIVAHSIRQAPGSVFSMYDPSGGTFSSGLAYIANNEAMCASQYNGSHMSLNHAAGWTDFSFRVRMAKNQFPPTRFKVERKTGDFVIRAHDVFNRVTFGVRNCWALVHF